MKRQKTYFSWKPFEIVTWIAESYYVTDMQTCSDMFRVWTRDKPPATLEPLHSGWKGWKNYFCLLYIYFVTKTFLMCSKFTDICFFVLLVLSVNLEHMRNIIAFKTFQCANFSNPNWLDFDTSFWANSTIVHWMCKICHFKYVPTALIIGHGRCLITRIDQLR